MVQASISLSFPNGIVISKDITWIQHWDFWGLNSFELIVITVFLKSVNVDHFLKFISQWWIAQAM